MAIGAGSMYWYTYKIKAVFKEIIDQEITAYKAAQDMELALSNQKGFLTYYFIDEDPRWLRELGQYRQLFRQKWEEAYSLIQTVQQKDILDKIKVQYEEYIQEKDQVIQNYKLGNQARISQLHKKQRYMFFDILESCENYKKLQWERILQDRENSQKEAQRLQMLSGTIIIGFIVLTVILIYFLIRQILNPIRALAMEAGGNKDDSSKNEIMSLSDSLHSFLEDFDYTHTELSKSREHLEQAEKMALVGKLASGVAHTIRNPFTSVKMRLFSLSRNLELNETQKEDFDVISEEIGRIDNIVQNFLEFARPPKLRMQKCYLDEVIQSALQLMQHKLSAYDVEAVYKQNSELTGIQADPEQLKEVVINLIINACEAIENKGFIEISTSTEELPGVGQVACIKIKDSGPGISESIKEKIFQPFFTTKEEGTGLGLSIISRIVEEHRGWLEYNTQPGQGTVFIIKIPFGDNQYE